LTIAIYISSKEIGCPTTPAGNPSHGTIILHYNKSYKLLMTSCIFTR